MPIDIQPFVPGREQAKSELVFFREARMESWNVLDPQSGLWLFLAADGVRNEYKSRNMRLLR